MLSPKPVHPGDVLRMIAISGVFHDENPDACVERAARRVEALGYRVIVDESCYARYGYLSGTDVARARTLERAFLDPESDGVICMKGGYGCIRMMHLVDWERIAAHPKAFVGFSDITTVHLQLQKMGMVSFHGPMGSSSVVGDAARAGLQRALAGEDFELRNPDGTPLKTMFPGTAEGILTGGNLSLLAAACGTPGMPDMHGRILLIEEIGEKVYAIDRMMHQLKLCGVFRDVAGVVFGGFTDCEEEYPDSFHLMDVLQDVLADTALPVVTGLNAGHVAHALTVPLGRKARLDAGAGRLFVI